MTSQDVRHPGINLGSTDPEMHAKAEEVLFGFWVYMMSDLILFTLMFATYATMQDAQAGGPGPKDVFDLKSVGIETGLLLVSSFTYGMASIAMKYRHSKARLLVWLGVTLLLGLGFLGFELHDFLKMIGEGAGPQRSGFLSSFFGLVGLHGLHVTAGCIWIAVMMVQVLVLGVEREVKTRIMRLGLFWHLLDIVWVGIFSIVYLQGLAG